MKVLKVMIGDLGNVVKAISGFTVGLIVILGMMVGGVLLAAAYPTVVVVLAAIVFLFVFGAAIYGWVENARDRARD